MAIMHLYFAIEKPDLVSVEAWRIFCIPALQMALEAAPDSVYPHERWHIAETSDGSEFMADCLVDTVALQPANVGAVIAQALSLPKVTEDQIKVEMGTKRRRLDTQAAALDYVAQNKAKWEGKDGE